MIDAEDDAGSSADSNLDLATIYKHFDEWLELPLPLIRNDRVDDIYRNVSEEWKVISDWFKNSYEEGKHHVNALFAYAEKMSVKAQKSIRAMDTPRKKDSIDDTQILLDILGTISTILLGISNDFENDGFNEDFYSSFAIQWYSLFSNLKLMVLVYDTLVSCAVLDVFAAIGNDIFSHMPESLQTSLVVFLLGHSQDLYITAPIRSKIGRCLGKLIEFPSKKEDPAFFLDIFKITARNILEGESTIKVSYAWTFANMTDALVSSDVYPGLTKNPAQFLKDLLDTAAHCFVVPIRGRYSACRAAGNILGWLKPNMPIEGYGQLVAYLVGPMVKMIGNGLDYKLRWNAAHALGHAVENAEIFHTVLRDEQLRMVICVLSKWAHRSQNYKERTQCVVSLAKGKSRSVYGENFMTVFDALGRSLVHLPVEESENMQKFKTEVILLFFHLMKLAEGNDVVEFQDEFILPYAEVFRATITEVFPDIPPERLDDALIAKDNLTSLRESMTDPDSKAIVESLIRTSGPLFDTQEDA